MHFNAIDVVCSRCHSELPPNPHLLLLLAIAPKFPFVGKPIWTQPHCRKLVLLLCCSWHDRVKLHYKVHVNSTLADFGRKPSTILCLLPQARTWIAWQQNWKHNTFGVTAFVCTYQQSRQRSTDNTGPVVEFSRILTIFWAGRIGSQGWPNRLGESAE